MVLVDTSVWIRYLSGRDAAGPHLEALLAAEQVAGHEFVFGELLSGDKGGRRQFVESYALIDQAPIVPHQEVVAFVRARRLHGRGIGWIDVHLLASSLVGQMPLWTLDPRLEAVARDLDTAYSISDK